MTLAFKNFMTEPAYEKYEVSVVGTCYKTILYLPRTALDFAKVGIITGYKIALRSFELVEIIQIGKLLDQSFQVCIS
jgi:hypothetical protein